MTNIKANKAQGFAEIHNEFLTNTDSHSENSLPICSLIYLISAVFLKKTKAKAILKSKVGESYEIIAILSAYYQLLERG